MTNSAADHNSEHDPDKEENPPDHQPAIDPNSDAQYQRIIAGTEENVRDTMHELAKSAAKGATHGLASRIARWLWDQFMN